MKVFYFATAAILAGTQAKTVEEATFDEVENFHEHVVVFYKSSDGASDDTLAKIREVADAVDAELPNLSFVKVDGDLDVNKAKYDGAGFKGDATIFTTLPAEGIQKYDRDFSVEDFTQYLKYKYAPSDEDDVLQFSTEKKFKKLLKKGPVFVKHFEQWCAHCKALKPGFQTAATHFSGEVSFLEVECSKNDKTKEFCQGNGVASYPTLYLYAPHGRELLDGGKNVKFEEHGRNIQSYEEWFASKLGEDYQGKKKSKKKSKTSKKSKKKKTLERKEKLKKATKSAKAEDIEDRVARLEASVALLMETLELNAGHDEL